MRSKQEIRSIVEGYIKSGMTRRAYCERHDIPITTLDYWRRAHNRQPRLVEVTVEPQPAGGFTLVLANGRRIESPWKFAESDLRRLIRAAEA
jgi:transposase-like protein